MELITRTAKLIPYGRRPRRLAGHVTAYTFEPMADDTASSHGNLYVVIEVLTGGRQSEDTADLIIETFGRRYYDADYQNDDILGRFEHALKATNRELSNFIGQGNAAWVGKLSAVIAVQSETQLHLAHAGSAEAFLYRGKSAAKITTQSPQASAPSKTFGTVTSGELEDGDRLLISTPALFHQLPLVKLKSIITGASPSGAVSEITKILEAAAYAQIDRIAVILVELVSPERAASQPLSTEPSEVHIGTPETPIEAVKYAAAPLAQATAQQARTAHEVAQNHWDRSKPHVERAKAAARSSIQSVSLRPRYLLIGSGAVIVIICASLLLTRGLGLRSQSTLIKRYNASYLAYKNDQGTGPDARPTLVKVQSELAGFSQRERAELDRALADATKAPGAPRTLSSLQNDVQGRLDEIDHLTRVDGTTVAALSGIGQDSLIETNKGLAYVISRGATAQLIVVNLSTGKASVMTNKIKGVSDVLSSTISYDKRGLYLLTTSDLWFYDFASEQATRQQLADGTWEASNSIASYATNLYALSDSKVYKHTKNLTGYSPKTVYAAAEGATGIAVDGSVVVGYPGRVDRLAGGNVTGSVEIPSDFARPFINLSTDTDNAIVTDRASGRIGVITLEDKLAFNGQYMVKGLTAFSDAECDLAAGACYVLSDGKLLSFNVPK